MPVVKNPGEVNFQAFPGSPACFTGAVLNGDPAKGPSTMILKATKDCRVPWHWHSASEQVMMTSGVAKMEMKGAKAATLRAGAYGMMPAHHVHQFTCMTASCALFLRADGVFDMHYVNADGKEIPAAEAVPDAAPPPKP